MIETKSKFYNGCLEGAGYGETEIKQRMVFLERWARRDKEGCRSSP